MQIIDSTGWGVRSARLTFKRPGSAAVVTLFPMIHVGEAGFYERVYRDAAGHDIVLLEGINSPIGARMVRSYSWLGKRNRLGLVVQPAFPKDGGKTRVILSDLSADEFAAAWAKVPLWIRLMVAGLSDIIGLRRRWFATRRSLAKGMTLDDKTSVDEDLNWDPATALFTRAIIDARDERLIEHLSEQIAAAPDSGRSIAVMYGATHMRAVVRALARDGFHCVDAEWLLVFSLDMPGDAE